MESLYELKGTRAAKVLVLENNLTINNASALKEILLEAIDTTDHLIIYFENVTSIDLACIQILCAANTSFLKENKYVSFKGDVPSQLSPVTGDVDINPRLLRSGY